ncbi:hypothetical protein F4809DRAFT_586030 [Biscogniauxia mediterranea]|nr:hypothetical protein F4809DRAFT_586030 [Biscogniauxia mediterranea]
MGSICLYILAFLSRFWPSELMLMPSFITYSSSLLSVPRSHGFFSLRGFLSSCIIIICASTPIFFFLPALSLLLLLLPLSPHRLCSRLEVSGQVIKAISRSSFRTGTSTFYSILSLNLPELLLLQIIAGFRTTCF